MVVAYPGKINTLSPTILNFWSCKDLRVHSGEITFAAVSSDDVAQVL